MVARLSVALLLVLGACDMSRPVKPAIDAGIACDLAIGTGSVAVDLRCKTNRCAAYATEDGCNLSIALTECDELGSIELRIAENGEVLGGNSDVIGSCEPLLPRSDSLFSVVCTKDSTMCRADVYRPGQTIDAETVVVQIAQVEFEAPNKFEAQAIDRDDGFEGFLADAAVVGDRIAVSSFRGEYESLECNGDETELVFVERTSMAIVHTATAPDCLTRLVGDPLREELIGVFGSQPPVVGRFDRDGKLIASREVVIPENTPGLFSAGLHLLDRRAFLVITSDEDPRFTYVLTIEIDSLETVAASDRLGAFSRASEVRSDGFYLADVERALVQSIDLFGQIRAPIPLLDDTFISDDVGFFAVHPGTNNLLVSATGRRSAVWRVLPGGLPPVLGRAQFYEHHSVPWAMAPWPRDQAVMAVGMMRFDLPFEAELALYDVEETRFRAGTLPLGRGLVSKLITDPENRLWALLPWSAELVRITPR